LETINEGTLRIIILAVMLFGMMGLLIPVLPGLVIIWVAALVYGIITGFSWASGAIFFVLTILMIVGSLIDNVIIGASARHTGASWAAIGAAMAAGLIGSLIVPPFGGLVLALIALFAVEYSRLKDWRLAVDSTRGMAMGCGWAVIVRLGIALVMIFMWGAWTIWL
jgi:uncharacterized protein